ncbi:MAG: hypothetical protein ABIH48_02960 [Candidatus Falkowbacteria bacterium]
MITQPTAQEDNVTRDNEDLEILPDTLLEELPAEQQPARPSQEAQLGNKEAQLKSVLDNIINSVPQDNILRQKLVNITNDSAFRMALLRKKSTPEMTQATMKTIESILTPLELQEFKRFFQASFEAEERQRITEAEAQIKEATPEPTSKIKKLTQEDLARLERESAERRAPQEKAKREKEKLINQFEKKSIWKRIIGG